MLGHELSHVYNRDILISSVAAGAGQRDHVPRLPRVAPAVGAASDDDGPGPLGALLLLVLGPVAAGLIQMAISRSREYQADASGAAGHRRPARAGQRAAQARARHPGAAAAAGAAACRRPARLMIANPFRARGRRELFSTHPPMAERIARLEQMAGYRR